MAKTHDYTNPVFGHDCIFRPINGGQRGRMSGWGYGISGGDYLLLKNGARTTRYVVESIKYHWDPPDMWSADVAFAPRTKEP